MATDRWPDEEGHVSDGLCVSYCYAEGSITQFTAVKLNSTDTGRISIDEASYQEGVGVALKAGDTDDWIPVCFYGIVKMTCDTANAIADGGNSVVSGTTAAEITGMPAVADTADNNYAANNGTGTLHVLGMALSAATTDGDEILVLIGGAR